MSAAEREEPDCFDPADAEIVAEELDDPELGDEDWIFYNPDPECYDQWIQINDGHVFDLSGELVR